MLETDKTDVKAEINKTSDTLRKHLQTEVEKLRTFVNNITS